MIHVIYRHDTDRCRLSFLTRINRKHNYIQSSSLNFSSHQENMSLQGAPSLFVTVILLVSISVLIHIVLTCYIAI